MNAAEIGDYLKHMRAIRAEEALLRVAEIAVGNGVMKQHDQRSLLREWRKAAGKKPNRLHVAHKNREGLARMGLGLKVEDV